MPSWGLNARNNHPPAKLIDAVGLDQILGHTYAELIGQIAALPDRTGHAFRVDIHGQALTARDLDDQLRIHIWNAPGDKQSLELELRVELSETRMRKHFTDLPREVGYNKDLSDIGWFDWESCGVKVNARLHDWMFELRVIRHA